MLDWLQKVISGSKREPQRGERRRIVHEPVAPRAQHKPATLPPVRQHEHPPTFWQRSLPYKKGERIGGRFNIYEILGKGGFGIVYLAFDSETRTLCTLKTFRDEMLTDGRARAALVEEGARWVDLGDHPHILSADSVLEIVRRLYVRMEYIVPDDVGRTTLAHYLRGRTRQAISLERQLEWAVQFCLGMEHANRRGIAAHRDIKPENIMIKADGSLKIADFGMAAVLEKSPQARRGAVPILNGNGQRHMGSSVVQVDGRTICGTPGYTAPEVFLGATADVRSDIYSFGVVLWQMAAHSAESPFRKDHPEGDTIFFFQRAHAAQMADVPQLVAGPLRPIIGRCLHCERGERYESFEELRKDLEELLWQESDRAAAFNQLGRQKDCIQYCDEALQVDPKNVEVLCNKGMALRALKQTKEALACFEECLRLAPENHAAWYNKSLCLVDQGRELAAIEACSRAVQLNPGHTRTWELKGVLLLKHNQAEQAVACFDEALKLDPRSEEALFNKARALAKLRHPTDAMLCFEVVLADKPDSSAAWLEKGRMYMVLKKYPRAIECFDKALAVVPTLSAAWLNRGLAEEKLLNYKNAANCFTKFLELAGPEHERTMPVIRERLKQLRGGR